MSLAQPLFAPRAVALVGASGDAAKNTARPQRYLKKHGYAGRVFPINPTRAEVLGVKAYPRVSDVPEAVEHAYILTEHVEQAIEDCTHGLRDFANYFGGGAGFVPLANTVTESSSDRDYVEAYAASGNVVIGTPDDAIAYIEDLIEQSGGFGTFLMLGHDWADAEATARSYRLFAREVAPHFRHQLAAPATS